ncbi:MAG: toxin-antitoxin system HicB family antitoxin [Prevotellaceae bacterium]|nr:toxin-antitoxin system HicB family antitoxin [Candidatus Minthosoma equi]
MYKSYRISPETHINVANLAKQMGVSVNSFIRSALEQKVAYNELSDLQRIFVVFLLIVHHRLQSLPFEREGIVAMIDADDYVETFGIHVAFYVHLLHHVTFAIVVILIGL